jgi:Carboxypeptidase regulatory-like domain
MSVLGRGLLPAAALAVCGSQAAALPVRVALDWPSGRPQTGSARIQAIRTAGPTEGGLPVEAEAGPNAVVLDLGDGVWHLHAVAPGYWSEGAEIAVGRETPAHVRLALWPAASVHGEILTAGGEPLPRELVARLTAVPRRPGETTVPPAHTVRPEPSPSRAELRCRVDAGAWSCLGPAGVFDVQLEAAGYAPRYAWDVGLAAPAGTDLGRTVLRRAASVFGRAVRRDGSDPQGPCHATVRADVTRRASPEGDAEDAPENETHAPARLSRRGYFHVVGVAPGAQVVAVECEAASAVREVRVQADRETRIDSPLPLEELTLDVVVTPPVDPDGRPWQLTVLTTAPHWRRIADRAIVAADGRWARPGLTAGSYRVAVLSSDGTQRLQRFFELREGSGPLPLRLAFVGVAGRVRLGARPLRARLVFVNEVGGEPATLTSDDDGRFRGLLPVAPDVVETRWTVEAHAAQPPINRRLQGVTVRPAVGEASAWLELSLPMVAVRGAVVSAAGDPQSGAQVAFEDTGSGARTITATDDAGSFEVRELPPGRYYAVAESVEGVSEPEALEVEDGVESELSLVLKRSERVSFHVLGSQGPVTDAAVQIWVPPGVPRGVARTDTDGRFAADLPPGTTEVGLTIGAPGHVLKLTRLPVSDEQTIALGSSGGMLVLDLERPAPASDATPYLVHDGAIEAAGALAGWGAPNAGASGGRPLMVEPGVYALCQVGPEDLAALWRGALPSGRCRTGSVEPGRTLILSLP